MAIQPTLQRTFDRFELQTELLLADWTPQPSQGGHLIRLGTSARYQAARLRVADLTLDAVLDAGVGWQRLLPDAGAARNRADFEVGMGLRMLTRTLTTNANVSVQRHMFVGLEFMVRLLVTPQRHGPTDIGCVVAFGIPFGR